MKLRKYLRVLDAPVGTPRRLERPPRSPRSPRPGPDVSKPRSRCTIYSYPGLHGQRTYIDVGSEWMDGLTGLDAAGREPPGLEPKQHAGVVTPRTREPFVDALHDDLVGERVSNVEHLCRDRTEDVLCEKKPTRGSQRNCHCDAMQRRLLGGRSSRRPTQCAAGPFSPWSVTEFGRSSPFLLPACFTTNVSAAALS